MAATKISKELKWLLKFINLGCTPGEFNLQRQLRKMRYYDTKRLGNVLLKPGTKVLNEPLKDGIKIKRPKTDPPKIKRNSSVGILVNVLGNVKNDGQLFYQDDKGEYIPAGKSEFYPSAKEYKTFFSKHGIPPKKRTTHLYLKGNMDSIIPEGVVESSIKSAISKGAIMPFKRKEAYSHLNYFYITSIHFIWYLMLDAIMEQGGLDISPNLIAPNGFVVNIISAKDAVYDFYMSNQKKVDYRKLLERNIAFDHDGSLPLAIFAFLLDFKHNHRELHARLRQCKCCGTFWIRPSGGSWEFCTEKCNDVFHSPAKKKDNEQKKKKREDTKIKEKPKIIKYLTQNKYELVYDKKKGENVHGFVSKERANQIYDEVTKKSPKNTSSLKEFIRTEGQNL